MMNGVMFGDKHSYRDFGLFLSERPKISPPKPKLVEVDIPGADGVIDLTEALTGDVKFENRGIECKFIVIESRRRWDSIYSEILDYLHGKRMKIIFDEDPSYYYIGRIQVDEWESKKATATIIIKASVEAYKLERTNSLEDWLWNPFNFETGIIREYRELIVQDMLELELPGTRKNVVPSIEVLSSENIWVCFSGTNQSYRLVPGKNIIPQIEIKQGKYMLRFSGNGTVSIDYQGGRL